MKTIKNDPQMVYKNQQIDFVWGNVFNSHKIVKKTVSSIAVYFNYSGF